MVTTDVFRKLLGNALLLAVASLLVLQPIPLVQSEGGGGVIIRHGRSRGRHSSERWSQQHPAESSQSPGVSRGNESLLNQSFPSSIVHEDNATRHPEKIIRLEAAPHNVLSYHPHPVRFSHKKAMEAKYKILKLTEDGLTNFKRDSKHKPHATEVDAAGTVSGNDNPGTVVLQSKGTEGSVIGGTQLSMPSSAAAGDQIAGTGSRRGTSVQRAAVVNAAPAVDNDGDESSETNNNAIYRKEEGDTTEGDVVKTVAWQKATDQIRNSSNAMLTHLHSYLFKAKPRKRQQLQPQMQIRNSTANKDRVAGRGEVKTKTEEEEDVRLGQLTPQRAEEEVGRQGDSIDQGEPSPPAVDKVASNKSISSANDRRLPTPIPDSIGRPVDTFPLGAANQDAAEERRPADAAPRRRIETTMGTVIGSELDMAAQTWQGADKGNDKAGPVENNGRKVIDTVATTNDDAPKDSGNSPARLEASTAPTTDSLDNSSRINEDSTSTGSGASQEQEMAKKTSFNSNNNINEAKSHGNADKRIRGDEGGAGWEENRHNGHEAAADQGDKSRQHEADKLTPPTTKIEEIVTAAVANVPGSIMEATTVTIATSKDPPALLSGNRGDGDSPRDGHLKAALGEQKSQRATDQNNNKAEQEGSAAVLLRADMQSGGDLNGRVPVISNGQRKIVGEDEGRADRVNEMNGQLNLQTNHNKSVSPEIEQTNANDEMEYQAKEEKLTKYLGYEAQQGDSFEGGFDTVIVVEGQEPNEPGDPRDGVLDQALADEATDAEGEEDALQNHRPGLRGGYDTLSRFLQTVEQQHLLGANCTAGTSLNLGEGVVDRYAQERFRVEAEIAVNRANMLTRIFKMTEPNVQLSEQLLHASVLSMVEFDDDIFAAGNCFDWDRHPAQKGLFCPFAHRLPPPTEGLALVKNLADEYHYLDNGSEWFYIARKNAERIIEKNEQYVKAYHIYSNSSGQEEANILSVKYEDGRWSKPYYDCGGGNIWMLTYTVPFFGFDHHNLSYHYMGTSGIDVDLRRVDIDQCPQRRTSAGNAPLNIFAGTDKCKQGTTECESIAGMGFRRGSYRCVCQRGFFFPDTLAGQKFFNGSTLEEEYEKQMKGELSLYADDMMYECLPCAEGCDSCKDASPCIAALNWPMRTSILVMACAIIGFLPPAALFTFKYQQVKVVRAASPALLRVIALGAFFIYCTTIVLYPPPSIYTCTARVWLREIGFSLTYGALMLKTWRISVIFRVRSAKAVKITDASLLKRLGILCGAVSAFLLIRTIVAPPLVVVGRTTDDLKAFLCKTDWWDHTFTSMEVLFLAWGVRLCIMVRKAPSEFNESRFISMAIYNEFLLTCFLNVSMLFLQSPANPDLLFIIFFCHTQLTVTLLLALIFGSKVYLVFRGGGKPDEVVGLGVKPSGAKFICRSQGRTFGNISTATSSTAQLGHYIGTEGRLNEQEALEEIRNLFMELRRIQERAPPRGLAVATIAAILDSCRLSGNNSILSATAHANSHNTAGNNNSNSMALKPPASQLLMLPAPHPKNNNVPIAAVPESRSRVEKGTNTVDTDLLRGTVRPAVIGDGERRKSKDVVDHHERSIDQLRKCLQNCPVVSSTASSSGDLLGHHHHHQSTGLRGPGSGVCGGGGASLPTLDYDDYVQALAEENINADTRSSDLDFANLQLECMCSSDSVISSPTESTYKCTSSSKCHGNGLRIGPMGKCSNLSASHNDGSVSTHNTNSAKNSSCSTTATLEEEIVGVVLSSSGGIPRCPTGATYSTSCTPNNTVRDVAADKSTNSGNCQHQQQLRGATAAGPTLLKGRSLNDSGKTATLIERKQRGCAKTLSCGDVILEQSDKSPPANSTCIPPPPQRRRQLQLMASSKSEDLTSAAAAALMMQHNRSAVVVAGPPQPPSKGYVIGHETQRCNEESFPTEDSQTNPTLSTGGGSDGLFEGQEISRKSSEEAVTVRKLNVVVVVGDINETSRATMATEAGTIPDRPLYSGRRRESIDEEEDHPGANHQDDNHPLYLRLEESTPTTSSLKSESSQQILNYKCKSDGTEAEDDDDDSVKGLAMIAPNLSGAMPQCHREGEALTDAEEIFQEEGSASGSDKVGKVSQQRIVVSEEGGQLKELTYVSDVPNNASDDGSPEMTTGLVQDSTPVAPEAVDGSLVVVGGNGATTNNKEEKGSSKKTNSSRNSPDSKLVLDLDDKSKYTKEVSV